MCVCTLIVGTSCLFYLFDDSAFDFVLPVCDCNQWEKE